MWPNLIAFNFNIKIFGTILNGLFETNFQNLVKKLRVNNISTKVKNFSRIFW